MTEAADMLVPAGHKVVVERHYEAASPGGLELVSCCDVNIYLGKLLLRNPTWQIILKKSIYLWIYLNSHNHITFLRCMQPILHNY